MGETGTALVEADEPRERSQAVEQASHGRVLPVDLEMREEPGHEDEVERAISADLVRDVDVATAGITDGCIHRETSASRKQSTVWSLTIPTACMNE